MKFIGAVFLMIMASKSLGAEKPDRTPFLTVGSRQWSGHLEGRALDVGLITYEHRSGLPMLLDERESGFGALISKGAKSTKGSSLPLTKDEEFTNYGLFVSEGECLKIQTLNRLCLGGQLEALAFNQKKSSQPYFELGLYAAVERPLFDQFVTRLDVRHSLFSQEVNGVKAGASNWVVAAGLGWNGF